MRFIIGLTGASGAIYAVELLRRLSGHENYLVCSRWGKSVLHQETGLNIDHLATFVQKVYSNDDMNSPFASGSNPFDALVIVPCSVSTFSKISYGMADNLITRCASVALKERRKLILCLRETPLSTIDLENAHRLSIAGAIVMPASPPFYQKPCSLPDLVGGYVEKIKNVLGLPSELNWRKSELTPS